MKRLHLLLAALAAAAGCATVAIDDARFGLRQASVFEVVTPTPFGFEPRTAAPAPPAPSVVPTMITHPVDEYLPITLRSNACLNCHDRPAAIGKPLAKGDAVAVPATHYRVGAEGKLVLVSANYNCMTCHAPQAGVKPLVGIRAP
jgi:cytochrome c-type protein NapB